MRWISISDLQASVDPKTRMARQNEHLHQCMEQAKLEQTDRHHFERMQFDFEMAKLQGQASIDREYAAGQNAIALADRNHVLKLSASSSELIDAEFHSQLKQQEEWSRTVGDTLRQLVLTEADTIRQERLKILDQKHIIEKMRLESNLKLVEMVCAYEIQNLRVTYDKACEIVFRLVERALGLGEVQAQPDQVRDWVREAMDQTGAF